MLLYAISTTEIEAGRDEVELGPIYCNAEPPNDNQNSGKWLGVCDALAERT